MFTEFVFNFGSCLSLKIFREIFKCRNSPVCSVSPKMDYKAFLNIPLPNLLGNGTKKYCNFRMAGSFAISAFL